MAAGNLARPGTDHGPCVIVGKPCGHRDCAQTRRMAAQDCPLCGQPIGYETDFYASGDGSGSLAHAGCAEAEQ